LTGRSSILFFVLLCLGGFFGNREQSTNPVSEAGVSRNFRPVARQGNFGRTGVSVWVTIR